MFVSDCEAFVKIHVKVKYTYSCIFMLNVKLVRVKLVKWLKLVLQLKVFVGPGVHIYSTRNEGYKKLNTSCESIYINDNRLVNY